MRFVDYERALNVRLQWLQWVTSGGAHRYWQRKSDTALRTLPTYKHALECGDTYFMNREFASLIDVARSDIPDELTFDPTWMVSHTGWMYIEQPFALPRVQEFKDVENPIRVSAIAWFPATMTETQVLPPDSYAFLCFNDLREIGDPEGFGLWSFFTMSPGEKVIDRIHCFEAAQRGVEGGYDESRTTDMLHEVRWIYTALHLMSQKLASVVARPADRATRRRMEREQQPLTPFLKIVTLRRLEQMRERESKGEAVDWSCQWLVHGHGRWQYYPSIHNHKYIWIEDYIKGPPEKPMKAPQHTIYVARR